MEEYDRYLCATQMIQNIPSVYDSGAYTKRGMAIIAIFQSFSKSKHPTVESVKFEDDLNMLKCAFELQQYKVDVWNDAEDMTKETFLQRLDKAAKDPIHKDSESFAMVILTHGKSRGMLLAFDDEFNMNEVYSKFTGLNCPALLMKPKMFIFHACRGEGRGKEAHASGWFVETNLKGVSIPAQADLLLVFSTFEGEVAFGPGKCASAFIYNLAKVLTDDHMKTDKDKEHILALMTNINRMTACFKWEGNYSGSVAKQQPVHMSTLLSKYYLRQKSQNATS